MMWLHFMIDLIAIFFALLTNYLFRKKYRLTQPLGIANTHQHYYLLTLIIGLTLGSVLLGSLNIYWAGHAGIAKSMIGGLFGAIVAAEFFKYVLGIKQSTGLYFIPGLLVVIVIGRIGCFYGGLTDYTYGVQTSLPWGVDFGDGIKRHPVQLYESITMALFLFVLLIHYPKAPVYWQRNGFYWFILVYASQRFIWEFLKPYPTLGLFNLFHLIAFLLILYATTLLVGLSKQRST